MSNPIEVYLKSFGSLPSLPSSEKELSVNMKIKKKIKYFHFVNLSRTSISKKYYQPEEFFRLIFKMLT